MTSRRIVTLAALLALTACSQQTPPPAPSTVQQPDAVVVVGSRLFISSLASDGLKVANVDPNSADYGSFLSAPNPVFSLDIPTVRRPTLLVALRGSSVRPLVVSGSSLDSQLRFVDASALTAIGAPVALPGRPIQIALGPDGTTLYVLVAGADDGSTLPEIVTVTPTSAVLDPKGTVAAGATVATVTGQIPVNVDPGGLAVTQASGTLEAWVSDFSAPQVLRVDLTTGQSTPVDSGVPLGKLMASPALDVSGVDHKLPAGAYVYGLGAADPVVVAFDATAGTLATQLTDQGQVFPILLPNMPVSMTAAAGVLASLPVSNGVKTLRNRVNVPILLLVPLLDGSIAYIDGFNMRPLDVSGRSDPVPTIDANPTLSALDSKGNQTGAVNYTIPVIVSRPNPAFDPSTPLVRARLPVVTMTPGVTRTRTWSVGWKAKIPMEDGVLGRLVGNGSAPYVVPLVALDDLGDRIQAGDTLTITNWHAGDVPAGCDAYAKADPTYTVTGVDAALNQVRIAAQDGGAPLPTRTCFPDPFTYSVTAGGYTVTTSDLDRVWRVTPGEVFTYQGSRFAVTDPLYTGPDFRFTLSKDQDPSQMKAGATLKLTVKSGLDPFRAVVDAQNLQVSGAYLPGQPAAVASGTGYRNGSLYVPFAGSGIVVSFDLGSGAGQRLMR